MALNIKGIIPLSLFFGLFFLPAPEGLSLEGWRLLVIFISTITGIILKPLPVGMVALIGMLTSCLTGVLDLKSQALHGFHNSVVWLIVFVFFVARGFINTGLGKRLAYICVKYFGKTSLGLGYAFMLAELLTSPFIPSNTARAGGLISPILQAVSKALGSLPNAETRKKIGAYLTKVAFHGNLIGSATFLTGMAGNSIAQALAGDQSIQIEWIDWFYYAMVPCLLSAILLPLILYVLYKPKLTHIPEAVDLAKQNLEEMGPISKHEYVMMSVFLGMLTLWVVGPYIGISSALTALLGLCTLFIVKIISWDDVMFEKGAWNTFIWLSILMMMSSYLQQYGVITWFSESMKPLVATDNWLISFTFIILVYFYSHYLFASNSAHISAMYAAFLALSIGVGVPAPLAAVALGYCSNLFGCLTHFGSGGGVVLYSLGYVSTAEWWRLGFITSLIYIAIWFGIGGYVWKLQGLF